MGNSLHLFVILAILAIQIQSIYSIDNLYTSEKKNVYYIDNGLRYSWFEALTKCASMDMSLATIDTKEKSDEVTALLKKTFGNVNPLWIGGVLNGNDHHFTWIATGNKATYTNWADYQPDFHNNNEYCLQTGWSKEVKWNDHECQLPFGLICEYNNHNHLQQQLQEKDVQLQKEQENNKLLLQLLLSFNRGSK